MPSDWETKTLGEVVSLQRGHDLPEPQRRHGHIPILGSFGVTGWHDEAKCRGPGVTVGRSGASFGVVSFTLRDYWPLNTVLFATDFHGNDERFIYYLLRRIDFSGYNSGSAQPSLNRNHLQGIALVVPPPIEQRAIAGVLGSLDDKIEQNRRTSAALEQLARAIFRAWFVDFEPVKAKAAGATAFPSMPQEIFEALPARLVDSTLGPLPEGWRAGRLGDISQERRELVDPSDIEQTTPYIGLEDMPRHSIALAEWGNAAKITSGKARFRAGQILFGKLRPYFHKVGIAPIDGVCSTDIVVVEPMAPEWFGLTLAHCSSDIFVAHTNACSTGTKMPRTNWRDMAQYAIAIPPAPIAAALNENVLATTNLILNSVFESRKIAELRDYLLPKLLSGNIRVEVNDA